MCTCAELQFIRTPPISQRLRLCSCVLAGSVWRKLGGHSHSSTFRDVGEFLFLQERGKPWHAALIQRITRIYAGSICTAHLWTDLSCSYILYKNLYKIYIWYFQFTSHNFCHRIKKANCDFLQFWLFLSKLRVCLTILFNFINMKYIKGCFTSFLFLMYSYPWVDQLILTLRWSALADSHASAVVWMLCWSQWSLCLSSSGMFYPEMPSQDFQLATGHLLENVRRSNENRSIIIA